MALMMQQIAVSNGTAEKSSRGTPRHFEFIDALRGWAILAVIASHVGGTFGPKMPDLPRLLQYIAEKGHLGVQLFFVVSACTLFLSLHARWSVDRRPVGAFFIRRFFRIAPLFWLGTLFYLWVGFEERAVLAPNGLSWLHILSTFAFVHTWYPTTYNSVTPGGWSIGVEANFYLLVPLLFVWARSLERAVLLMIVATLCGALYLTLGKVFLPDFFPAEWVTLVRKSVFGSLPNQLPVFCCGIIVYHLLLLQEARKVVGSAVEPHRGVQGAMMAGSLLAYIYPPTHVLAAVALSAFLLFLSQRPLGVFVNPVTRFVGVVSFSAYLWHFYILETLGPVIARPFQSVSPSHWTATAEYGAVFAGTLAVTLLVSWLTYRLIEVPGQEAGKWLIRKLQWGR